MKIALSSINPVIGDYQYNVKRIKAAAARAGKAGCGLLILPELALCGSPPPDLLRKADFLEAHDRAFADLLSEIRDIAVLCGIISRDSSIDDNTLYNSAALFEDGKVQFIIHKHFLKGFGTFRESDYFDKGEVNLPIPFRGKRLGITLGCEIMPDNPGCKFKDIHNAIAEFQKMGGADLFINLAATPFNRDKARERRHSLADICRKYQTPLLHVNQAGGLDSFLFDGRCLAINEKGEICRYTLPFREGLLIIEDERPGSNEQAGEQYPRDDFEDIFQGLITGIRDYVHKSDFSKVVLGLGGGVDSALTCILASRALGPENVLGVALPAAASPPKSITAARQLAENLGIEFETIPLDKSFRAVSDTLEPFFKGVPEDDTETNIQAAIRGNLLTALADKFNRLLLSTGNKSDLAYGCRAIYDDNCGALAPLADIPMTVVYELAALANREAGEEIIPESIIAEIPDGLPPYEILDPIIHYRLEYGYSIAEIVAKGYDPVTVKDVIRRLEKNRYNRRRLPPKLWMTSPDFGQGTDRPLTATYQGYD